MDLKKINHSGKVLKVNENKVWAEILVSEACGSCQAKNMCFSKGKAMTIEAQKTENQEFKIGEEVNVNFEQHLATTSVFLAYVLPLIIFFVVMFSVIAITDSQDMGCLSALATIPLYYIMLYTFRNRLRNTFKFKVDKK